MILTLELVGVRYGPGRLPDRSRGRHHHICQHHAVTCVDLGEVSLSGGHRSYAGPRS